MFELGDTVTIVGTYADGTIVGRAEFLSGGTTYLVRFVNGDNNLVKEWFEKEDLEEASEEEGYDEDGGFSDDEEEDY